MAAERRGTRADPLVLQTASTQYVMHYVRRDSIGVLAGASVTARVPATPSARRARARVGVRVRANDRRRGREFFGARKEGQFPLLPRGGRRGSDLAWIVASPIRERARFSRVLDNVRSPRSAMSHCSIDVTPPS